MGHDDTEQIELVDWTAIHRVRRRLYRVQDVQIPVPTTSVMAAAGVTVLLLTKALLGVLGVAFTERTSVLYLAPAIGAFLLAGREALEGGRTVVQYLRARARFLLAPAALVVG